MSDDKKKKEKKEQEKRKDKTYPPAPKIGKIFDKPVEPDLPDKD